LYNTVLTIHALKENQEGQGKSIAEAIFSVCFPEHSVEIFKQLREVNYKGFVLASSDSAIPLIFNAPEANGVYLPAPIIYNPNFLFAKEVKEKYKAKHNKPFNHFSGNGYDTVKLLAGLLEDKEISRKSVKTLLEDGFIYPGVFGTLDVKPGEHNFVFPLHPAQIVDGTLKYLR